MFSKNVPDPLAAASLAYPWSKVRQTGTIMSGIIKKKNTLAKRPFWQKKQQRPWVTKFVFGFLDRSKLKRERQIEPGGERENQRERIRERESERENQRERIRENQR